MPPRRPAAPPDGPDADASVSYQLGQISGQMRELVHGIVQLQATVTAIGLRVAALEASDNRREGASGLMKTILKSPMVHAIAAAAITAWAFLTGKVHA